MAGYSPWGRKDSDMIEQITPDCSHNTDGFPGGAVVMNLPAMWETWAPSLGGEDPLEKGMATHSSVLAWKIPRTEEPDGLQSMGSQTVRHD